MSMIIDTPRIKASRLSLEPFSETYLTERYVGWLNDPDVVRYSEQRHRQHSVDSCRAFIETFDESPSHIWAIVAHDDALGHIGNVHADVGPTSRVADVAIVVGEKAVWGQGFGFEAFEAVSRWLLDEGGMRKVTAGTLAVNHGMLGIMRKMNMVDDGIRRQHLMFDGEPVDVVHMALWADNKTGSI